MSIESTYIRYMSIKSNNINMTGFNVRQPFNALPALPPQVDIETTAVLKRCVEARAALAQLKQVALMLPDQSVLTNTLPMLEAQASSEIENIVTTTDRLFQFADTSSANIDPATKEALQYRTALYEGYLNLKTRPLNTTTAEKICTTIKAVDMAIRKTPGTALQNDRTGDIIYTPPEGEALLREKMANWELFLHSDDDLDILIKMAIGHYQFEAIHPFTDGNGRTGRIVNILYLIDHGLLDIPILYLSRFIIQNKAEYYRLLLEVTLKGEWTNWIIFMLNAVEETSRWTSGKINAILKLMGATRAFIRAKEPKIYSSELVDVLFSQPYCRISNLAEAGIAKRQTGSIYLAKLASIGVLVERKVGREKIYTNPRYMRLLTSDVNDFEAFGL
ncbi:Fic family protein MloA [hydrothermal vent metagenome]|uniref:Fic family protein MloA n=1 Tax=hydrothermal vent metagenome TaxID=652676 RepID=A0A3B0S0N9_9ZZZZ